MGHPFDDCPPGTPLRPLEVTVSAEANRRYYEAAGAHHPALEAGALYPPIAANLTILCFGQHCPAPMIQTRQQLRCRRVQPAGVLLVAAGEIAARYEKRGRRYLDVVVRVATADDPHEPFWESVATFTPAQTLT